MPTDVIGPNAAMGWHIRPHRPRITSKLCRLNRGFTRTAERAVAWIGVPLEVNAREDTQFSCSALA